MASNLNDPMGQAILDFANTGNNVDIIVSSDICDDDIIPSAYLHRSYDEMPMIEKTALTHCEGKILDIGAGAGVHASFLKQNGKDVSCIDTSPGAINHMKQQGLSCRQIDFFELKNESYDTLLMLMNGIGIAGKLTNLERTLLQAKSLLRKNGKIICDSSDIKYLYEDEDGGVWMDLNAAFYGDFKFQMKYKDHSSETFDWLYVDFENLQKAAEAVGMIATQLASDGDEYLAEIHIVE